jgi:hypothetical protein
MGQAGCLPEKYFTDYMICSYSNGGEENVFLKQLLSYKYVHVRFYWQLLYALESGLKTFFVIVFPC